MQLSLCSLREQKLRLALWAVRTTLVAVIFRCEAAQTA